MVGLEEFPVTLVPISRREIVIGGDPGALAQRGDRIGRPGRTVGVDHQSRIVVQDQEGVEPLGKLISQCRHPQVPAHVARTFLLRKAQILQTARNRPSGVVAGEQKRGGAPGSLDPKHDRIVFAQQCFPNHDPITTARLQGKPTGRQPALSGSGVSSVQTTSQPIG